MPVAFFIIEIIELLFKRLVAIHDLEEDPDANPDGVTLETPEGKYLVELKIEGPDQAALRQLTMDLMAHNPFELARFLEVARATLREDVVSLRG